MNRIANCKDDQCKKKFFKHVACVTSYKRLLMFLIVLRDRLSDKWVNLHFSKFERFQN